MWNCCCGGCCCPSKTNPPSGREQLARLWRSFRIFAVSMAGFFGLVALGSFRAFGPPPPIAPGVPPYPGWLPGDGPGALTTSVLLLCVATFMKPAMRRRFHMVLGGIAAKGEARAAAAVAGLVGGRSPDEALKHASRPSAACRDQPVRDGSPRVVTPASTRRLSRRTSARFTPSSVTRGMTRQMEWQAITSGARVQSLVAAPLADKGSSLPRAHPRPSKSCALQFPPVDLLLLPTTCSRHCQLQPPAPPHASLAALLRCFALDPALSRPRVFAACIDQNNIDSSLCLPATSRGAGTYSSWVLLTRAASGALELCLPADGRLH